MHVALAGMCFDNDNHYFDINIISIVITAL